MEKNKNNRYLVGIISGLMTTTVKTNSGSMVKDNEIKFYSSQEFSSFYDKNDILYLDKPIEDLAVLINSPWSQDTESYSIKVNCKDGYTEMNSEDPTWKCEYKVIGYDGITATIFGYGNTEVEALTNCKNLFKILQENYNEENILI